MLSSVTRVVTSSVTSRDNQQSLARYHTERRELRCPRARVRVWKLVILSEETLQSLNTLLSSFVSESAQMVAGVADTIHGDSSAALGTVARSAIKGRIYDLT